MTQDPDFKGYIHDVGGPTANFRAAGLRQAAEGGRLHRPAAACARSPARQSEGRSSATTCGLLRKLRALPGVKKVFIRSGIRFDYVMADPDPDRHVSARAVSSTM